MNKIQKYLIHNQRKIPIIGYVLDVAVFFRCIRRAILKKKPRYLLKPVMLVTYTCLVLSFVIWGIYFRGKYLPTICVIIFPPLTLIAEIIYCVFFHKMTLWDPEHKVYRSENHPYGDAQFMSLDDEDEVFDISKNINTYRGKILGIDTHGNMVSKKLGLDYGSDNCVVFGPTGTKKDVGVIIPQGLQMIFAGISGVLVSTKGGMFAILAPIAKALGYTVRVFDLRPGNLIHSDGIDLMKLIGDSVDTALSVASLIIANTSPGERKDYWYRGEENLLDAIILYFAKTKGTLVDVYHFLEEGLDYIEAVFGGLSPDHPAHGPFSFFKEGGLTSKQQVVQGLGFRMSGLMAEPTIQEILSHNDIQFKMLDKKKYLIFVHVSDKIHVYKALSATFFQLLFFVLGQEAEKNGGSLRRPVEIMINEAFSVGAIQNYAENMATVREYGAPVTTVLQDYPQLMLMYPDIYEDILNNCGVKMLVHTDDIKTAEYFATLCGTFTGENITKNLLGMKTGSREASIPLLSVSDILGKDINKQLVYITGAKHPAIMLDKQLWYADWPGSKTPFVNAHKGKSTTYMGHPLLRYFNFTPVTKHLPKWRRQKTDGKGHPIKRQKPSAVEYLKEDA